MPAGSSWYSGFSSQRITVPHARKKPKAPPACTTAMGRYSTCLNLMAADLHGRMEIEKR